MANETTSDAGVPSRLLTEEQLLSMPASDYMSADQLDFFRRRLKTLEQEILTNADATADGMRTSEYVSDPTDRATIEEEQGLELRTRDRERKLLAKVQQAIARIDAGQYGWCEDTGDPIGIRRLLARPTASLSVGAQERRELKQKTYGE